MTDESNSSEREHYTVGAIVENVLQTEDVLWQAGSVDGLVRSISLYDREASGARLANHLLLGVNVSSPNDLRLAVEHARIRGAAALVVKGLALESTDDSFPVVGISSDVTWTGLLDSTRMLLNSHQGAPVEDDEALTDLFALANALAEQVGAAVIIEDRSMRLLAFSHGQEAADPSRVDTILRRRASQGFMDYFKRTGKAGQLYAGKDPIYLEREVHLETEGLVAPIYSSGEQSYIERRLAIGIRAGARELGAIWAAIDGEPDAEISDSLRLAAKVAARHILRVQAYMSKTQTGRSEALQSILWGHPNSARDLQFLQLPALGNFVCVVGDPCEGEDPDYYTRLEAMFKVYDIPAVFGSASQMTVGIVVPSAHKGASRSVRRLLERFTWDGRSQSFGIGDPMDRGNVVRSRVQAEYAYRVALGAGEAGRVSVFAENQMTALLQTIASQPALYAETVPAAPLRELAEYDARTGSDLVPTLRAYIGSLGSMSVTATRLYIHGNSLRYRIARILEITGLDLNMPDAVAEISLQLYLMRVQEEAALE